MIRKNKKDCVVLGDSKGDLSRFVDWSLEVKGGFYFLRKQKVAKTFDCWIDSIKVRDSLLIHESPKWILRYAQYDEKGLIRSRFATRIAIEVIAKLIRFKRLARK